MRSWPVAAFLAISLHGVVAWWLAAAGGAPKPLQQRVVPVLVTFASAPPAVEEGPPAVLPELPKSPPSPPLRKPSPSRPKPVASSPKALPEAPAPLSNEKAPASSSSPEPDAITSAHEPAQTTEPSAAPVAATPASEPDRQVDYRAAYLDNPPPDYPLPARRRGISGQVLLRVEVSGEGRCLQARIHRGSGYEMLDRAALNAVRNWRFVPAMQSGKTISAWVEIPIRFELKGEG